MKIDPKNLIGLDLLEAMKLIREKKAPLKVGAKDGTGYFYCGYVGDFEKRLGIISDQQREKAIHLYNYAESELRDTAKRFPRMSGRLPSGDKPFKEWVKEVQEKAVIIDTDYRTDAGLDYLIECARWAQRVKDKRRTAQNAEKKLKNFRDFEDRGVMDAFESSYAADERIPLVIITSGYEVGGYWTVEEANEKENEKRNRDCKE